MTFEKATISAIVCTRNRGDRIKATIESILANEHSNFELLIVDQSTNDLTETAVRPFFTDPRLRYIRSDTVGLGLARQIGITQVKSEIVAYTDDDCIVPPNWLSVMQKVFEDNPRVAVAFCNVLPTFRDPEVGFIPIYERPNDKLVRKVWEKCFARGMGAGLAVRRKPILALGGFDVHLGPGAVFSDCDDGDIALRALLKGWWVYETTQVAVLHDGFRTWQEARELSRRNWMGIGAAYAKPIKCQHWKAMAVVAYEGFIIAFLKPLSQVFVLRRPRGIRSSYYFWKGFMQGLKAPVNHEYILYDYNDPKN